MRYIGFYNTSGSVQTAIDEQELGKPYVVYLRDEHRLDWNSKSYSLPDKAFLCNYNAKTYDSATTTIFKTDGQLFDRDLVLERDSLGGGINGTYSKDGYIMIDKGPADGGYRMTYDFANSNNNIFNRYNNETGRSFTIVYKASANFGGNIIGNKRLSDLNYQVKNNEIFAKEHYMSFSGSESPAIFVIRVWDDGYAERKCLTTNQTASVDLFEFGTPSRAIGFLCDSGSPWPAENFTNSFYWLYVSNETLTDEEVAKVVTYNEKM